MTGVQTCALPISETAIPFSLFPKRGGRSFDADGSEDLRRLGALIGRMHALSSAYSAKGPVASHRPSIGPGSLGAYAAELEASESVDPAAAEALFAVLDQAGQALDRALGKASARPILLHGDFHRGNVLDRGPEGLIAIDFDDCCTGPAIQDLWMLLPGTLDDSRRELDAAMDGYERFMPFDCTELRLIEPLRLLRMAHFLAWQARQLKDPGFLTHFPRWGTRQFWEQETEDLRRQLERLD